MQFSKSEALNSNSNGFESFLQSNGINTGGESVSQWMSRKEKEFWLQAGIENKHQARAKSAMLYHTVEKARTRWACITAKSQRTKNFRQKNGVRFVVNTYQNMTEVKPDYERATGANPPSRKGEQIHQFTKRSRQRMMSRARKLNHSSMEKWNPETENRQRTEHELPVPYFVTLTYHKNFKDCEAAKNHLNAFFQRWRRRSKDFAYFWKMEPQKRGAVHFHIAMFIPDEVEIIGRVNKKALEQQIKALKRSGKWKWFDKKTAALQLLTGKDWAEITKDIDGYDVPYTKFDYIRKTKDKTEDLTVKGKTRKVKTKCANPRTVYKIEPDWEHERYGTNVRKCENWKAFLGYVGNYMKKEVSKNNPLSMPTIKAQLTKAAGKMEKVPFRYSISAPYGIREREINIHYNKTGRFWGFSNNLDFKALQTGIVDYEDLENMNDFCNHLNFRAFQGLVNHLIDNANRIKENYSGREKENRLKKCRKIYEAQKRRFYINREKIKKGYMLQWEIPAQKALEYRYLLKEKTIDKEVEALEKRLKLN